MEKGKLHAYLDVEMDEKLDLRTAHEIIDGFEKKLIVEIPEIQKVTTHQEVESDEQVAIGAEQIPNEGEIEKIRKLVLSVENVRDCRDIAIINIKGERHITLTITVAMGVGKERTLEDAHRIATDVQNLLSDQIGVSRVVAHVEPAGG